ncbi:hypothetical protein V8E53_002105 [Lactarius tabidus]
MAAAHFGGPSSSSPAAAHAELECDAGSGGDAMATSEALVQVVSNENEKRKEKCVYHKGMPCSMLGMVWWGLVYHHSGVCPKAAWQGKDLHAAMLAGEIPSQAKVNQSWSKTEMGPDGEGSGGDGEQMHGGGSGGDGKGCMRVGVGEMGKGSMGEGVTVGIWGRGHGEGSGEVGEGSVGERNVGERSMGNQVRDMGIGKEGILEGIGM